VAGVAGGLGAQVCDDPAQDVYGVEFDLPVECSAQTSTFGGSNTVDEDVAFIEEYAARHHGGGLQAHAAACLRDVAGFLLDSGLSFISGYDCVTVAAALVSDAEASGWDVAGCVADAAGGIVGTVVSVRRGKGAVRSFVAQ
jgi:hypothetical protein